MTKTRSADQALAADAPQPVVTTVDAIALTVGIVIGAGIFRTPALIAANSASEWTVYLAWALGGIISVMGALVYSELATTYPHAGGDYHYLTRAFGHRLSFLFAWARMSVIQTGAITFSLFVFGDYLSEIFSLGTYSSAIYAGLAIVALTVLNITGVREGTGTQNFLTSIEVLGVILVIVAGLLMVAPAPQAIANTPGASLSSSSFGLVMVFVLLTYGGWGEAAYVSAELRDVRRNMVRVLMLSILLITTLYLLINWAYLHALGLAGTAKAEQVGAVIMNRAFGERGRAWGEDHQSAHRHLRFDYGECNSLYRRAHFLRIRVRFSGVPLSWTLESTHIYAGQRAAGAGRDRNRFGLFRRGDSQRF
jgi:basic amino acid/polyamine antiporter, APA family